MPRFTFLLALLCVPFVVGCEGCRRDPRADRDKDAEEKAPLDAFTTESPDPFPSAGMLSDGAPPAGRAIKPGHWITASVGIKSNKDDARGELFNQSSASGVNFRTGTTEDAVESFQTIPNSRPVVLPKGQLRRFDFRILPPIPAAGERSNCSLSSKFVSSGRSVAVDIQAVPFLAMQAEEYFFVILTSRPERFAKLRKADWVKPFRDQYDFPVAGANYRIVAASTKDLLPLAETMLDWTNTAVVLWDDVNEDILTPDQQTAFADWVRFGGQLIVNGPDASDAIGRGGLSDILPLKPTGHIELDPAAGEILLNGWQVPTDSSTQKQIALMKSQAGRVAVDGQLASGAAALIDSGGLILQRSIGRGLVTQSRFDMTSDWMVDWDSFDSFFNSAVLNRVNRRFVMSGPDGSARQLNADTGAVTADATDNTRLRIAARDAKLGSTGAFGQLVEPERAEKNAPVLERGRNDGDVDVPKSGFASLSKGGDPYSRPSAAVGIGGWTDSSDIIEAFRQILRSESGIEIPKSSLVVRSLGYYLLILVPLNFIVFRLMGRLEYAWLAVPVIAIAGAVLVARAARLDIGFARSRTELAMLELQPDYPRGHLTRIDAIYNSLSSTYEINFKTIDGCALPIRSKLNQSDFGDPVFKTSYDEGPTLSGLAVGSNQVRLIHAEQMIDVGGTIRVDESERLVNDSSLEIEDAYVVEKIDDENVRVAVVGSVTPESTVSLRFRDSADVVVSDELPMQTARIIRRLASPNTMPPGSMRLVGRVEGVMESMSITPDVNQTSAQTIVLVHLKHPPIPTRRPDVNLRADMKYRPGRDAEASDKTPRAETP